MAAPKAGDPAKSAAIMLAIAAVLILVGTASKSWFAHDRRDREFRLGVMGAEVCYEGVCMDRRGKLGLDGDIELFMTLGMLGGFVAAGAAGVFGGLTLANKRDKLPPAKVGQVAFGVAAFSMTYFFVRVLIEARGEADVSWAGFVAIGGLVLASVGLKQLRPFIGHAGQQPLGAQAPPGAPPYAQGAGQPPYGAPPYGPQGHGPQAGYGQPQGYGQQPSPYGGHQSLAQQSQPMQPMAQQSQPMHPMAQQSQPMQPMAQQSQPMQPMAQQSQPMAPHQPPQHAAPAHACPRCGSPLQFVAQYQRWYCAREQQYV